MAEKNINANNEEQFNTELQVGLNLDQLSYICEYCGKVNSISATHCIRCGKRRPRNEYVAAMSKVKNAKSIKAEYIDEKAKIELEKKEVANMQLVRLVEGRVADETAQFEAQQAIKLDQDREAIRKVTAREAVLRIIAAEKAAEDRVAAAERKADDAIKGRNAEIEAVIMDEREKTLKTAAQKLVVERAGIEEAARERMEASRKQAERAAREGIDAARDNAEKNAARRAVLQVIAAEKANEDMLRMSKNALQQAALERIEEERKLAEKEYEARFAAEKWAIEKAADERIKAEKEALRKVLEGKDRGYMPNYGYGQYSQGPTQTVQPISIVPYLNANQPVYQYNPNKVVYKFVPNALQSGTFDQQNCLQIDAPNKKQAKAKVALSNKSLVRITSVITLVLAIAVVVLGVVLELIKSNLAFLPILSDKLMACSNSSILLACGQYIILGINSVFKASIAVPAFMAGGEYFLAASGLSSALSIIIPLAFTLFIITNIIVLGQSITRIVTGRANLRSKIVSIIQLVFMVAVIVGVVLVALKLQVGIASALLTVGIIAFTAVSVVSLVLVLIASKKVKSSAQTGEIKE